MNQTTSARLDYFTTDVVDRAHHRRRNKGWLDAHLRDPATRFIVVWGDKNLFTEKARPYPVFLPAQALGDTLNTAESLTLLGTAKTGAYFAVGLAAERAALSHLETVGEFRDLRLTSIQLDHWESAVLAHAKAMVYWHRRHRFCGDCGSPTISDWAGHLRVCTNPECRQQQFPRTDPAIIVRVTSGDQCLLGRQPIWRPSQYSNIAGFVEPCESLEFAVRREVNEETGVQLKSVQYHSSQPWPFPSSLMLGFTADAATRDIHLNDGELEDAGWFTRAEIKQGLEQGTLGLPSLISISFRLLEGWFDEGYTAGTLRELVRTFNF